MKLLLSSIAVLVLTVASVALVPPGKSVHAEISEKKQVFSSPAKGTYVVHTREGGQGHPIENPKIVYIADRAFLTGIGSGRIETYQDSIFSGGHTFFQLR